MENKKKKKIKTILVTGGNGAIGSYVPEVFKESNVILASKEDLDITKKAHVSHFVKKYNPDLIIHLAALTNVDFCEQNKHLAKKVNYEGTKNIALICKMYKIPLVYVSTATVFGGKNPPKNGYTEDDTPSPINTYGKTKLAGEKIIEKTLENYIIIRIGWLVGGKENDKFFISYMSKKILIGEDIFAVNDIFGTLAYAYDMLVFVKDKIMKEETGLYHFASKGICTRYDIALVLKKLLNPSVTVTPVKAESFRGNFPALRPKFQVITSNKYKATKTWENVLIDYIKTVYK